MSGQIKNEFIYNSLKLTHKTHFILIQTKKKNYTIYFTLHKFYYYTHVITHIVLENITQNISGFLVT